MQETGLRNSAYGADKFGFQGLSAVHWNLTAPTLYEHAIAAGEAAIIEGGPICAETGVPCVLMLPVVGAVPSPQSME